MAFTNQTPSNEKLQFLIKKYRKIQIEKRLKDFHKLDYPLRTSFYQNLLLKNRINVLNETVSKYSHKLYLPVKEYPKINFTGLLLGVNGDDLRLIEQETRSRIFIKGLNKDQSAEPVYCHVIAEDTNALKKAINILNGIIEEVIFSGLKPQDIEEEEKKYNDWEKFYLWWYYHNNVNKLYEINISKNQT